MIIFSGRYFCQMKTELINVKVFAKTGDEIMESNMQNIFIQQIITNS